MLYLYLRKDKDHKETKQQTNNFKIRGRKLIPTMKFEIHSLGWPKQPDGGVWCGGHGLDSGLYAYNSYLVVGGKAIFHLNTSLSIKKNILTLFPI